MRRILQKIQGDKVIWAVVLVLSLFSLLAVYSSSGTLAYRFQSGNTEYYLIKHFVILVFGLLLMYFTHKIKYSYFSRLSQIALYISVPLLIATLFIGESINDANRWITLPVINLSFQSSDFAKLALITYLARIMTKKQDQIKDFKSAFLPVILPVFIICGLILPANFSTAAVLFATCVVIMFIGRLNTKYILMMMGAGIVALTIFIVVVYNMPNKGRVVTWKERIENFIGKDGANTYQSDQAKIAIASGGLLGKMPGNSTQRNFLPQAFSDFIYAIIIEEYGLIGGIIIVLMYLILLFRGIRISNKSPGTFGALLAAGLSFSLVFQAMINMAVAVNLLPVTGQPLPLVSMGGTSLWFTSLSIGVVLSVSRYVEDNQEEGGGYATV